MGPGPRLDTGDDGRSQSLVVGHQTEYEFRVSLRLEAYRIWRIYDASRFQLASRKVPDLHYLHTSRATGDTSARLQNSRVSFATFYFYIYFSLSFYFCCDGKICLPDPVLDNKTKNTEILCHNWSFILFGSFIFRLVCFVHRAWPCVPGNGVMFLRKLHFFDGQLPLVARQKCTSRAVGRRRCGLIGSSMINCNLTTVEKFLIEEVEWPLSLVTIKHNSPIEHLYFRTANVFII